MRLYHAAKISEYQFRKLLHLYVADATVAATCRLVRVSGNSVSTLHNRLRSYYVEAGLFTDPYHLGSHMEEEFEIALLQFHLARLRAKRRLCRNTGGLDIHLAESHWRFHFFMLAEGRDASSVQGMMFAHLFEIITLCGPIGTRPDRSKSLPIIERQADQRARWLERNAHRYADPTSRDLLREIQNI